MRMMGTKGVRSKTLPSCISYAAPIASTLPKSKHILISMQIIPNMNEVQRRWEK